MLPFFRRARATVVGKDGNAVHAGRFSSGFSPALPPPRAAGTARRPGRNVASELDMDAEFDAVTRERAWVSFASGDEDALERERWGDDAESVDGTVDSMDDDLRRYTGEGRG